MDNWTLVYDSYDPDAQGLREALCTLGNGVFATRGALPEASDDGCHYPGTYLAGGYNRRSTEIAGEAVENESLVNLPNWLPLTFRPAGGDWFHTDRVHVLDFGQRLALRDGVLSCALRFIDGEGRVSRYRWRRIVSLEHPHLAAIEAELTPENWGGMVEVRSALDGRIANRGVARYRQLADRHLEALGQQADAESLALRVRFNDARLEVVEAARTLLYREGRRLLLTPATHAEEGYAEQRFTLHLEPRQTLRIEKTVALHSSRDRGRYEPGLEAGNTLARSPAFGALLGAHRRLWRGLWDHFNLELAFRDPGRVGRSAMVLHLHIFHVLQTASTHTMDLDVGVPARGLHGEAYRGHIFWDELFVFPLLNLRLPEVTRSLLVYRYRRLGEARAAADDAGYRGAMFPWQSGSNGREESQRLHLNPKSGRWLPDNSRLQRHVGAAIAFNIYRYYQITQDTEFLICYGAEMFLEIARFWASIATYNRPRDRFEIRGVLGPDEYHDAYPQAKAPGIDNNAYTNLMAAWVLWRARAILDALPGARRERLLDQLGVDQDELDHWERVSRRIFVPFHGDGIISQFEGYERLEELDWERYRREHGEHLRLDRILEAEDDSPNRYQASKQADVLMLFYLFSADELRLLFERLDYPFDPDLIPRTVDYYLHRTAHGSTLSHVVHAWVLARSDRPRSWRYFLDALDSDVADVQGGTTPEGIHLGAMAGTVDIIQRCYTGLEVRGDILRLDPDLPDDLRRLGMHLVYRGHYLDLFFERGRLWLQSGESCAAAITVDYRGRSFDVRPGDRFELSD